MAVPIGENGGMASKGTDGRTRRRWSAARKAAILAAPSGPGTTPSAIARRHALSPGLLHRWRRGWAPQPGPVPPRFAEVIVDAGSPRDTAIENETPALRLRAPVATRAETLVAILGAPRGSR
jgi:transposase-like protein